MGKLIPLPQEITDGMADRNGTIISDSDISGFTAL